MRVAFDSRPVGDPRGIGRYAGCLLEALREQGRGEVVEARRPPRGVDVFHAPWLDGAPLVARVPVVVTLHDLVPLKRPDEYLRTGLRFRLRYAAVRRATRVIVPTRAVARDAQRLLGLAPDRVEVVPEAAAPAFRPRAPEAVAAVRRRLGLPDEYLLWVGGLRRPDPRKRVPQLVAARRSLPLVLAGDAGAWARRLPGVVLTGRLDDDDLAAVYTGARALVLPSDDEGFGLTAVEALACGTPVAATDVPALREVLGDRALWGARDDLDGLLARAAAAPRPAPPPPPWTWADAAAATWTVYERATAR